MNRMAGTASPVARIVRATKQAQSTPHRRMYRSMYVLSQTSLRSRIASASSSVASPGTTSSKLMGDQKRFQIDAAGRGCETGVIALELTPRAIGGTPRILGGRGDGFLRASLPGCVRSRYREPDRALRTDRSSSRLRTRRLLRSHAHRHDLTMPVTMVAGCTADQGVEPALLIPRTSGSAHSGGCCRRCQPITGQSLRVWSVSPPYTTLPPSRASGKAAAKLRKPRK